MLTIRVPPDDSQCHQNDEAPKAHEDREHDTFLLERFNISIDKSANETLFIGPIAVLTANSSGCDRLGCLVDIGWGEDEDAVVDSGHLDVEVVVQESQRIFQCINLGPDEALDELLSRALKDSPIEHGRYGILDVIVELVERVVERGGSPIDPSENTIVDGVLNSINMSVDTVGVGC